MAKKYTQITLVKEMLKKLIDPNAVVAAQDSMKDEERERIIRFLKFAGFLLILVVLWYVFDIANAS
ncbi:MAG: hypothetical protein ACW98K_02515 [Candidatus Kariarchaeaceae archaeon]|jgi:type VI protein secretion system component VasK